MGNNVGKNFGLIERNEIKGKNYTIRETITVKIAPSGTVYTDINRKSTESTFGHAWIEFKGESIGWGMGKSKMEGGSDNLTFHDSKGYDPNKVTSVTLPLYTNEIIGRINNAISKMKSGDYTHFESNYNLFNNNCIDFVNYILALTENGEHNPDYILQLMGDTPNKIIEKMEEYVDEQKETETPLVIALVDEGIFTLPDDDNIYFDHNNDGVKESTGWIDSNSAFLVFDKNENGIIDNGNEMFGNNTPNILGDYAKHGFDALSQYDNNQDNRIDNNDVIWSSLNLWVDKNINGETDIDELVDIECSGIEAINLIYENNGIIDENGNQFLLTSSVIWNDGRHTEISDIVFNTHISSQQNNTLLNSDDIWL
ncbi:hypothetical protein I4902_13890 [Proteus alimentorum]|uniref:Calcium-binding protein n=1 Tax=Proteus alimentorum TaxID=1973495 RepID=A0ABS0IYD5_9GAMM|nr:hypothetical protein [Proteus alimentorum]MBG2877024.1 hypothetical protein [Proteus alimentorum]MBG2880352.1 hypothetical protein [Proteus alimentorum]